jgi:outer membrane protein TolC
MKKFIAATLTVACSVSFAQQASPRDEHSPVRPHAPVIVRPYRPVTVPAVHLGNSGRFGDLIRGGKLYLTAHDAIALAIENNIDLETGRFDASDWRIERAEAGGALPGVPTGASQAASVASGQGVLGSQAAAGVRISGSNGANAGANNVTVQQVGTVAQTYDPTFQEATTFSHRSLPQPNALLSVTSVLVQNQRVYTGSYQQGFATGGSVNLSYNNHYLNENAPTDLLNPSVAPTLSIQVQQNLLQGFGVAVNTKDIRVARLNAHISDLNFRASAERTIVNVLNAYYSLVSGYEDLKAKRDALETAEKFLAETKRRVDLGAAAQIDITTAQNQLAAARQAHINSLGGIQQADIQLRNLISRTGLLDPAIANVQVVPLDRIEIPPTDEIPPLKDLVQKALQSRSDLLAAKEGVRASEISAIGTTNGLLPSAVLFASKSNQGTAGVPHFVNGRAPDAYFDGGIGNALGQIFRNNFPSQGIGGGIQFQARDRVAQADFAIDQLQLRQQELGVAKQINQAQVDIANSIVALRQARARYEAAVQNRILEQKLYEAEEKKFAAGESTTYNVTQQQRDFVNAQASELSALVSWENARINLNQTTGVTLETNHVTIEQAKAGQMPAKSTLPATLPE